MLKEQLINANVETKVQSQQRLTEQWHNSQNDDNNKVPVSWESEGQLGGNLVADGTPETG